MATESQKDIDFGLMRQIQLGDAEAFGTLVGRYRHRLMNVIGRMLSSIEEAEDIVQETFVKVHQHRHSFNFEYCCSTWIYTIGLNLARNVLRKRKLRSFVPISDLQGHEAELVMEAKVPGCLPQVLHRAIQELPEKYRVAFMLRDVQEMPYDQVGDVLGIPLGTAKSRVYRARLLLRDRLQPIIDYGPPRRPQISRPRMLLPVSAMGIREGN